MTTDNSPALPVPQDDSPMLPGPLCEVCGAAMEVLTEMALSPVGGGQWIVREMLGKSWECPNWRNHRTEDQP